MDAELTRQLIELVERAGDAILEIYRTDFSVDIKTDNSPLTQADLAAHRIIAAELAQLTPEIPLLSEESRPPSYTERKSWSRYWLVDPLDGTKEFVNRNGEFTVNIALIDDHRSVFGVVGVPVQGWWVCRFKGWFTPATWNAAKHIVTTTVPGKGSMVAR